MCEPTYAWTGFPRPHLVVNHRDDREAAFAAGEDRLAQHEYLEWHVTRDARGRITKVTFTTETPEYWEALAETEPDDPARALPRARLARRAAARPVRQGGRYVRDNVWNHARGIVHYVMKINGIAPLINAEQDTPIRGRVADNYDAMPLAFANGTPLYTAADARFSLDIGVLQRQGLSLTVREPLGLYMIECGRHRVHASPTARRSATTGGSCAAGRARRCGWSTRCRRPRASWSATSGSAGGRSATAVSSPSTSR